MRGMRNAYYARDNFDVRRGGRGFSCAVKNTLISQKDAVDTRTFRVKPNTPKLLSMPGKNGGQLWDLPSISMMVIHQTQTHQLCICNREHAHEASKTTFKIQIKSKKGPTRTGRDTQNKCVVILKQKMNRRGWVPF